MNAFFISYAEWVVRYRKIVVAVTILITALALFQAQKIKLIIDMNATLPQSHPFISATNDVERIFGAKYVVVVGMSPKNGDVYNAAFVEKVVRISNALVKTPGVLVDSMASITAKRSKTIGSATDGIEVKPLFPKGDSTPQKVDALKAAINKNPVFLDGVVGKDGRTMAVIAEFKESPKGFRLILDYVNTLVC